MTLLDIELESWPEHYPNVAQAKYLLSEGVTRPLVSILTRVGTVEGFGSMIRYSVIPDLQRELHEDMRANFRLYPKLWGLSAPDANIDHRRVPNLMKYFERRGKAVSGAFEPGDIVAWSLPGGLYHIGIVIARPLRRLKKLPHRPFSASGTTGTGVRSTMRRMPVRKG